MLDIMGFGIYLIFASIFFTGIYVILLEFKGSIYELLGSSFVTGLCGVLAYPLIEEVKRLPDDWRDRVETFQKSL